MWAQYELILINNRDYGRANYEQKFLPCGCLLFRELASDEAGQERILREVGLVVVQGVRQHKQEHNSFTNTRHVIYSKEQRNPPPLTPAKVKSILTFFFTEVYFFTKRGNVPI
jgi:hypothetical protein